MILLISISNIETSGWATSGMKGYKRLWEYGFHITFYNLYNLVTDDKGKCFTEESSRVVTFRVMFPVKHVSIRFMP